MKRQPTVVRLLGLALAVLAGCTASAPRDEQHRTALDRARVGKALFDEKCRTEAGEKIYKTVPEVEGLLLMKVRPKAGDREWADPMWPGAAFAKEATGDEYIKTFLAYEEELYSLGNPLPRPITKESRGGFNTSYKPGPKKHPGYRWVETLDEKDGTRYRYSGRWDEPWQYDKSYLKGYIKFFLDRTPSPSPTPPRYGVTYEDHVIPAERALGLASSTVKVLDLQTGEVLAELLHYAWTSPPNPNSPSPWLRSWTCYGAPSAASGTTRVFVDQVLVPQKDD